MSDEERREFAEKFTVAMRQAEALMTLKRFSGGELKNGPTLQGKRLPWEPEESTADGCAHVLDSFGPYWIAIFDAGHRRCGPCHKTLYEGDMVTRPHECDWCREVVPELAEVMILRDRDIVTGALCRVCYAKWEAT